MRWQTIKTTLQDRLPASSYDLWIAPIKCAKESEDAIELTGPDRFFCSWVKENYLSDIENLLQSKGIEVAVHLNVEKSGQSEKTADKKKTRPVFGEQLRLPKMPRKCSSVRSLHPRYTFDEFMVGQSNELAKSASEAIANGSTDLGQCLYIEGGTGLGKSHLSQSVAHHILSYFPSTRLHYLTARQLTTELVRALKSNSMESFKDKYQYNCDVLLVDDVHTLKGRMKTQEELAATLDVLLETGKRIIFTGAIPPKDIPDMDARVRSRLSAGLITPINPPDFKTREIIVRHKAKKLSLNLKDDVIQYIAEHVAGDIRQIESSIVGLKAKVSLSGATPDLSMVKEVLAGIVNDQKELTVVMVRDFLARQFKISVDDMQSKTRKKEITFPRQISMYLSRKLTDYPLTDIGKAFNRDHSTVVHAVKVITDTMARNTSVRGQVDHLAERLKKKYL